MTRYIVLIDGTPGALGVVFPDLPGCTAMGETMDGAIANARAAMLDWILETEADGRSVPAPRSAEALTQDPEIAEALREGAVFASVPLVREAGGFVRANLSINAGILSAIDATATAANMSRSEVVATLAKRHLHEFG